MPNVNLTADEIATISNALAKEVASAKRAQTSGKTPQIKEVYKLHEATINELAAKLVKAR